MTYVFDIDGTICSVTEGDYSCAKPYIKRIEKINKLYDEGNTIIYQTARGMGRHKNDINQAITQFYEFTKTQLDSWEAKYHQLFLGKPAADIYIDDKGVKDEDFFNTKY